MLRKSIVVLLFLKATALTAWEWTDVLCADDGCTQWVASAEALYWRVKEQGLEFGPSLFVEVEMIDEISIAEYEHTAKSIPREFHWGGRFGISRENRLSGWGFEAYWTHLVGNCSSQIASQNRAKWRLQFDTLDLHLGYVFYLNRCLQMKGIFGLEAAWIQQKISSEWLDRLLTQSNLFFREVEKHNRSSYSGIGPKIGLIADWQICGNWNLYGSCTGAAWLGQFDLHHHTREPTLSSSRLESLQAASANPFLRRQYGSLGSGSDSVSSHKHRQKTQYVVDAAIGIRWRDLLCDWYDLSLGVAYEYYRVFDQNQLEHSGDLIMDGLTLSGTLTF